MLNVLIIAAHPDDEVLGMGGTIKKLSSTNKICLCIVSEGATAQYSDKKMIEKRKQACINCGKLLGITQFEFLDFPDMMLDSIPHLEINKKLEDVIQRYRPRIVYTTPSNDLNLDHRKVFESTLVATRPQSNAKMLLAYEIPGQTSMPFYPNVYEDIQKQFQIKIKAFRFYKSEIMKFPHPRSIKTLEALATYRGMESGFIKAEAFRLIRDFRE